MKWWKHDAGLRNDPGVQAVFDSAKRPMEAYGFLCALIEAVAAEWNGVDADPAAEHSLAGWARVLGCHTNLVATYIGTQAGRTGILSQSSKGTLDVRVEWVEGRCRVTVASLAKWRDESARKKASADSRTPEQETRGVRNGSGTIPARSDQNRKEQIRSRGSASNRVGISELAELFSTVDDLHALSESELYQLCLSLEPAGASKETARRTWTKRFSDLGDRAKDEIIDGLWKMIRDVKDGDGPPENPAAVLNKRTSPNKRNNVNRSASGRATGGN